MPFRPMPQSGSPDYGFNDGGMIPPWQRPTPPPDPQIPFPPPQEGVVSDPYPPPFQGGPPRPPGISPPNFSLPGKGDVQLPPPPVGYSPMGGISGGGSAGGGLGGGRVPGGGFSGVAPFPGGPRAPVAPALGNDPFRPRANVSAISRGKRGGGGRGLY